MNPDGKRYVKHIAMSPDARYIGLIDRQFDGTYTDSFLYIFETSNLTPIWSKKFNDEHLLSIAISYNGSYIAVTGSGYGNTLYFFSKFNNKPLWTYPLKWELSKLSMSYYGSYLAVASAQPSVSLGFSETPSKGVVYLFHKSNPNPKWLYNINAYIPTIAISSNGRYIIIGDSDDNVYFFQR
jgi:WD40 repeat protein